MGSIGDLTMHLLNTDAIWSRIHLSKAGPGGLDITFATEPIFQAILHRFPGVNVDTAANLVPMFVVYMAHQLAGCRPIPVKITTLVKAPYKMTVSRL